jgi:hypothetical protein
MTLTVMPLPFLLYMVCIYRDKASPRKKKEYMQRKKKHGVRGSASCKLNCRCCIAINICTLFTTIVNRLSDSW